MCRLNSCTNVPSIQRVGHRAGAATDSRLGRLMLVLVCTMSLGSAPASPLLLPQASHACEIFMNWLRSIRLSPARVINEVGTCEPASYQPSVKKCSVLGVAKESRVQ